MTKYEYGQLLTYLRDGHRAGYYINQHGRLAEWGREGNDVAHLNRVASYGWRVVGFQKNNEETATYLLERQLS
ncbi:hypothetical protein ABZ570_13405 [Micromonospora sp. NPDC007271]|uniref:hypothetical protein n=1 Tax=Micromonospora sp. NPDC007271 TaxID=3154587 RepID=UPI0033DD98AA